MSEIPDSASLPVIRIGEVAKELGLSQSTLRQYEELGIVLPFKEESGQRMYSRDDIEWLRKLPAHFAKTKTGPTALARLLRLIPTHAIRLRRTGQVCSVKAHGLISWQVNPAIRRQCRACPAYRSKDQILDFETHFRVVLIE